MKKEKLIARIIAILLILSIAVGFVIPYVYATTAKPSKPDEKLPQGFEYVYINNKWVVAKTKTNDKPAIMLTKPREFDATSVLVFIGNVETQTVRSVELFNSLNYVSSVNLEDGYYVIYSNNFAWSTSSGKYYMINGGECQYIYIGDNYDPDLYDVEFERGEDIFEIALGPETDSAKRIEHGASVMVNSLLLTYPTELVLEKLNKDDGNGGGEDVPPTTTPTQPSTEPAPIPPIEGNDYSISIGKILLSALDRSKFLLIGIAVCGIGMLIVKNKQKAEAQKRTAEDKYDEKRID